MASDERAEDGRGGPQYRVEAEVVSKDAAYILREIIEDNVDCRLTAFDENGGSADE